MIRQSANKDLRIGCVALTTVTVSARHGDDNALVDADSDTLSSDDRNLGCYCSYCCYVTVVTAAVVTTSDFFREKLATH